MMTIMLCGQLLYGGVSIEDAPQSNESNLPTHSRVYKEGQPHIDTPADTFVKYYTGTRSHFCGNNENSDLFDFLNSKTRKRQNEHLREMYLSGLWNWKFLGGLSKASKESYLVKR